MMLLVGFVLPSSNAPKLGFELASWVDSRAKFLTRVTLEFRLQGQDLPPTSRQHGLACWLIRCLPRGQPGKVLRVTQQITLVQIPVKGLAEFPWKPILWGMPRPRNKIRNFSTTVDLLFAEMMGIKRRQDQMEAAIQAIIAVISSIIDAQNKPESAVDE